LAIRLFESGAAGCRNAEQKLKGVGILWQDMRLLRQYS
jgi:hypothetical protein